MRHTLPHAGHAWKVTFALAVGSHRLGTFCSFRRKVVACDILFDCAPKARRKAILTGYRLGASVFFVLIVRHGAALSPLSPARGTSLCVRPRLDFRHSLSNFVVAV